MEEVFVDTSAIYALLDRRDQNHSRAVEAIGELKRNGAIPLLTNFIVAESHALILSRLNAALARDWLRQISWNVDRVTSEDESLARSIIESHRGKTYSYTDATSFAVMKRRRLNTAFAFDHHFRQFGFRALGAS